MRKYKIIALFLLIVFSLTIVDEGRIFLTSSAPSLKIGDRGEEVKDMQQELKNWGYFDGNVDGRFGYDTLRSVLSYQRQYGLKANGIADRTTLLTMGLAELIESGTANAAATSNISNEQLLARAINGEARGEPFEGQVAVGAVILNRVNNSKFPKTVAGVIYQPGAFTAVSDGQINVPIDPKSTVVKAARDALAGWDPTDGCLYYWNPATATSKWIWSRKVRYKVGKHWFGV
ncbi:spore cortex-lytic enzyme [Ruminiclostridium cellulolyticum]|uniref:Spore cortex-lytic enzyme n=1 Tax=Ruminiclostridium cellulolyticum (strain ATCC 35319 / DSM 5812 / JCM 6584 / H10) TaxID=394503 RepID=B8I3U6_RUMCH|nr:spore cortex-lytic enzyme [Ruminiclostridium cellulolyticum]ACL74423.1 spore cortex-lytic enzyme [Ruminiclostridium cellulolyticum H10]